MKENVLPPVCNGEATGITDTSTLGNTNGAWSTVWDTNAVKWACVKLRRKQSGEQFQVVQCYSLSRTSLCVSTCAFTYDILHLSLPVSLFLPLNSDFELPACVLVWDFAASFILFKVSPAWPLMTHVAMRFWLFPFAILELWIVLLESEVKEKRFKDESKILGIRFSKYTEFKSNNGFKNVYVEIILVW